MALKDLTAGKGNFENSDNHKKPLSISAWLSDHDRFDILHFREKKKREGKYTKADLFHEMLDDWENKNRK